MKRRKPIALRKDFVWIWGQWSVLLSSTYAAVVKKAHLVERNAMKANPKKEAHGNNPRKLFWPDGHEGHIKKVAELEAKCCT